MSVILFLAFVGYGLAAPLSEFRMMELMHFVNNVPLADPKPYFNVSIAVDGSTDNKEQGFVDSGSLISFTYKVKGQQKR